LKDSESIGVVIMDPAPPVSRRRNRTGSGERPWAFDVARRCSGCSEGRHHDRRPRPLLSLKLIAECGDDLTSWPSAKHFTSLAGLAPSNKVSDGKMLSSRTRRSGGRAAALLRLAAVTVGRTDTALGAFYRRLSSRIGKAKAVTATARKIAVLFYNAVQSRDGLRRSWGLVLRDTLRTRVINNLHRRAGIRLCFAALGAESWCCRFLGIVLQCQLSDLGMERLHIDRGDGRCPPPDPKISEALPSSCDFPCRDLMG